jgi:hypothetical protein
MVAFDCICYRHDCDNDIYQECESPEVAVEHLFYWFDPGGITPEQLLLIVKNEKFISIEFEDSNSSYLLRKTS